MTTRAANVPDDVQRQGERLQETRSFEGLARLGLGARAVVYAVIGVLALKLAVGDGGATTNQKGALQTIAQGTFGKALLVLVAIGLAGYALWRLSRALLRGGPEQTERGLDRVGSLGAGIGYAVLCATAVKILAGANAGSGTPKKATGGVLDWTGGPVLVAIAGLVMLGVAIHQVHQGVSRDFLEDSKTEDMGPRVERAFTAVGVFGLVARAVVFALVGYGLVKAALEYDPDKAVGLDGALRNLADASYGGWLLGAVAAGLIGFAVYSAADARYRRV